MGLMSLIFRSESLGWVMKRLTVTLLSVPWTPLMSIVLSITPSPAVGVDDFEAVEFLATVCGRRDVNGPALDGQGISGGGDHVERQSPLASVAVIPLKLLIGNGPPRCWVRPAKFPRMAQNLLSTALVPGVIESGLVGGRATRPKVGTAQVGLGQQVSEWSAAAVVGWAQERSVQVCIRSSYVHLSRPWYRVGVAGHRDRRVEAPPALTRSGIELGTEFALNVCLPPGAAWAVPLTTSVALSASEAMTPIRSAERAAGTNETDARATSDRAGMPTGDPSSE